MNFFSSDILVQQIEEEFLNRFASLDPQHEYYETRKNSLEIKKKLDLVFSMKKSRGKKAQKKFNKRHRTKNKRGKTKP